jgi:hypothetical protein
MDGFELDEEKRRRNLEDHVAQRQPSPDQRIEGRTGWQKEI